MVLLTPGPVEVAERVRRAAAREMISHRGPEFRELLEETTTLLARLGDADEALLLAGSGTTAVDAMTWSLVPRGTRVLALVWGEFGERFAQSAMLRGADVEAKEYRWGEAPGPEEVAALLEEDNYEYVLLVHNETSTGLAYRDVEEIARTAKRHGAKLLVDSVSGFPVEELSLGNGVYAVATASHKALAAPPGVAIVLLSHEAVEELEQRGKQSKDVPPVLDLARYHWFLESRRETPFTPPVPTIYALRETLLAITEKGVEELRREHMERAKVLYEELPRSGYKPLVRNKSYRSNTVTAFRVPGCLDAVIIKKELGRRGYTIATGMGELKKRVIRIGVMGDIGKRDVENAATILSNLAEKCKD